MLKYDFFVSQNEQDYYPRFASGVASIMMLLTYHLVKAISGDVSEVLRINKYITDRLLRDYLSSSVSIYTKEELGYNQNPKAILDSSYENIIAEIKNGNL
ncbi:hypothetical protein [Paenibacillus dendritiformis]|uniref:hypothetical protein n=1 Tax=Paenibacillus dendritiformis TaxID=130049 RepID=UPI00387E1E86